PLQVKAVSPPYLPPPPTTTLGPPHYTAGALPAVAPSSPPPDPTLEGGPWAFVPTHSGSMQTWWGPVHKDLVLPDSTYIKLINKVQKKGGNTHATLQHASKWPHLPTTLSATSQPLPLPKTSPLLPDSAAPLPPPWIMPLTMPGIPTAPTLLTLLP
ncbi:hypothetical protein C0989_009935, partial [Termitomyces sp. Mn162]